MSRRFPAPWRVQQIDGGHKVVDDAGVSLAYVYARDDLSQRTRGAEYLTGDESRRVAGGIARLPALIAMRHALEARRDELAGTIEGDPVAEAELTLIAKALGEWGEDEE